MNRREELEILEAKGLAFWIDESHLYPTLDAELMKEKIPFEKYGRDVWVFSEEDAQAAFIIKVDLLGDMPCRCPYCATEMVPTGEGMEEHYMCPDEDLHDVFEAWWWRDLCSALGLKWYAQPELTEEQREKLLFLGSVLNNLWG